MKTEIKIITPQWATEIIDELERRRDKGFAQRPPRPRSIHRFAQDMRAGRWILTHQGIAFDEEGNLVDGQNRLRAVIQAGKPVEMMVTSGLLSKGKNAIRPMDVMDVGAPRTIWQQLQITHSYGSYAIELASVARNVMVLVHADPRRKVKHYPPAMSIAMSLHILEQLNYKAACERFISIVPNKRVRPAALMAAWCWYFQAKPRKAVQFAIDLHSLVNLPKGSPVILVHKQLSSGSMDKPRRREQQSIQLMANALMAYEKDEAMTVLKASDTAHIWLLDLNRTHQEEIRKIVGLETPPK